MKIAGILGLLGGLALFLYGMQMMSSGLEAAAGNRMKRILERLATNRFLGVAVGAGITAVLAAIGTSRNAKRTTVIHLMFNVIGTTVFTVVCMLTPLIALVQKFTPGNPAAQIANMHTLFNIVTTLMLLPLGVQMAAIAKRIMPDGPDEDMEEQHLCYIKQPEGPQILQIGTSAIIVNGIWRELGRMVVMAEENVDKSFLAVETGSVEYVGHVDVEMLTRIAGLEQKIDEMTVQYRQNQMIRMRQGHCSDEACILYSEILTDFERIGDHILNIGQEIAAADTLEVLGES